MALLDTFMCCQYSLTMKLKFHILPLSSFVSDLHSPITAM